MPSLPSLKGLFASSILSAGALAPVGAVVAVAVAAPAVLADAKPVEPYFIAVTKDNVPMKAAAGNIYYPVRVLSTGEILRVDAEDNGWLRVAYLPGTKAYVRVDEASFDEAAKTVKLTRPSKLMANNATAPRPWWPLLDADVPAGTTFANAEAVKGPDNAAIEGYLIPAPASARGYVRVEATRRATEAEVSKAGLSPTPTPAPTPAPPAAPATPTESAAPASPPATPAAPADGTITMGTQPTPPTSPTQPSAPAAEPEPTPAVAAAATPAPATAPPSTATSVRPPSLLTPAPVAPPAPIVPPVTSRVDDLQTLRGMFDRVITAGNEGEMTTVIAEFNRSINALGDSPIDSQIRTALQQRRQALEARQQLFDLQRRLANNDSQIVERTRQVSVAIEEAQKQAIYSVVGRMLPSTVYNGERGLPLMYRIESTDLSSTRTLGYVVPREGVELLTKMGKTVGIIGESKLDPALGVNIVAPRRVDVLEIVGGRLKVITDTQTTTTTTSVGGQTSGSSTTTTTTTTSGSITPPSPATPPSQPNSGGDVNR